ncbi:radical SAM protein [Bradyrhizobium sp.]|jgi:uncharacterized protein|uniref:radical SAM protein n=1 Tax=Bradyrhizobium sp. TaxID=376 RepID=UPI002E0B826E|nr:radical SAM protein [Bradyrhizobium sp.]
MAASHSRPSTNKVPASRLAARGKGLAPKCRLVVVKAASRCNLNCSYCYVYNLGDTSYLAQPAIMTRPTIDALVMRVAEHCARHRLAEFAFAFHGGEPLLARSSYFRYFVNRVAETVPAQTSIAYFMQTNGVLLNAEWCSLLRELNIKVGISLDGPKEVNDRVRIDHSARGSYNRIRRGWDLAASTGLEPGLLTVIDVSASPRDVFDHLNELRPRMVDFLFPDATHDRPPLQYSSDEAATPYADWLLEIFHVWIADERASFRIRLFERIINGILGIEGKLDALGPGKNEVLVVESDGGIEPVDVLKVCGDGMTSTPYNVHRDSLDDALEHPMVQLYYHSNDRLCDTCRQCRIRQVCAGGYLPHRYRAKDGFDNPSVYCRDLMRLITGIQNWLHASMPDDVVAQLGFMPLSYAEARAAIASAPAPAHSKAGGRRAGNAEAGSQLPISTMARQESGPGSKVRSCE